MDRILECIPNFSDGKNKKVIDEIAATIAASKDVKVLNIDMGLATNRSVITFAGNPDNVINAAFDAVKKASELIDMRTHKGVHPRIGATDVLPLVPVKGITMEETVLMSRKLAKRIGEELQIPVYCYEKSAFSLERIKLESIRKGEYEGLSKKILEPIWRPDFGPVKFNEKSGATVIGARDFLLAYNINLDTQSVETAKLIAEEIRESGKFTKSSQSNIKNKVPGLLKSVKAIGWYIEEYKRTQVSMNLTNLSQTPMHIAFETVKEVAAKYNVNVTGSELIGMLPEKVLIDAGRYFSEKEYQSELYTTEQLIKLAITTLGLSEIKPFTINERVIEYALNY